MREMKGIALTGISLGRGVTASVMSRSGRLVPKRDIWGFFGEGPLQACLLFMPLLVYKRVRRL
jgi:hypothetical protein